jgi:hypothetical protein
MTDFTAQLAANWQRVQAEVADACARAGRAPSSVRIVAVTKYVPPEVAAQLHALGAVDLGESRPQELWRKAAALPASVRWHLIGHLQRNKIDRTRPLTTLIHSVDSLRLLQALVQATPAEQVTRVLLEVNVGEAQKGGLPLAEVPAGLTAAQAWPTVRVEGLMCMARLEADEAECRRTFATVRHLQAQMQTHTGLALPELSMGMSGDFAAAIAEGATMVRIGSALFAGWDAPR